MSKLYKNILRPLLFKFSTETAHDIGMSSLRIGLGSEFAQNIARRKFAVGKTNEVERFGLKFSNPIGMAAGFDKNGVVVNQLASLGFGFVEVGTVTFEPQTGNEKPRLFRLPKDKALINRLGFNNDGSPSVVERLKQIDPKCVVGVNIGKNKNVPNEEATENYLKSFDLAFEVADYIAVNVSSPNTPNLRELQKAESLEELLSALQKRNKALSPAFRRHPLGEAAKVRDDLDQEPPEGGTQSLKPLLVKIAPDLQEREIESIVDIALSLNLSGIIATNTTIDRSGLKTNADTVKQIGAGGLSGKPVADRSIEVIRKIHKHSNGKLPIIGVGGVFTAEDAFEKIAAGACLVQAYTGFIYEGFGFAKSINAGLAEIVKEKGCQTIDELIGVDFSG